MLFSFGEYKKFNETIRRHTNTKAVRELGELENIWEKSRKMREKASDASEDSHKAASTRRFLWRFKAQQTFSPNGEN